MSSPTRAGFAAAFRHPSVVFAEILWRWTFGAGALLLLCVAVLRVFGALEVSDSELNSLHSHDPYIIAAALYRVFEGSGPRFLRALVIVLPAVSLLWILLASLGRQFSLRKLMRRHVRAEPKPARTANFQAMLGVHLLRVLVGLLGFTAWLAAILVASYAGMAFSRQYGSTNLLVYFLLIAILLPVIFLLWGTVHWCVALAPIFIFSDGCAAFASVAAAWRSVWQQWRAFYSVSTVFGLLRFIALLLVTVAAAIGAALASVAGTRAALAAAIVISLVYFAFADFLYIARLAAYLVILQPQPDAVLTPPAPSQSLPLEAGG